MDKEKYTLGKFCYSLNYGPWKGNFNTIKEAVDAARKEAIDNWNMVDRVEVSRWMERKIDYPYLSGDLEPIIININSGMYDEDGTIIDPDTDKLAKDFAEWLEKWAKENHCWGEKPDTERSVSIYLDPKKNYKIAEVSCYENESMKRAYYREFPEVEA